MQFRLELLPIAALAVSCSAPQRAPSATTTTPAPRATAPAGATTPTLRPPDAPPSPVGAGSPPLRRRGLFAASERGIVEIDRAGRVLRTSTNRPAFAARRVHADGAILYLTPRGRAFDLRRWSPTSGSDELVAAVQEQVAPGAGARLRAPEPAFPTDAEAPVFRPRTENTRVDEAHARYCLLLDERERYPEDVFGEGRPTSRELVIDYARGDVQFVDGSGELMAPEAGPRCATPDPGASAPQSAAWPYRMDDGEIVRVGDDGRGSARRSLRTSQWVAARDTSGAGRFVAVEVAPLAGGGGVSSFLYVLSREDGAIWGVATNGRVVAGSDLFDSDAFALTDAGGPHFADDDVLVVGAHFWLSPFRSDPTEAPGELVY